MCCMHEMRSKFIKIYWEKTVGLNEDVWVPVAPASANWLIWVHHSPTSLIPNQRTSKEDETRCSDSLQGICRNISAPCVAHSSELRSTHASNIMHSMPLYIDQYFGFCRLWDYFIWPEVWLSTGRMLISTIPLQLQELTPVFWVLTAGVFNSYLLTWK